MKAKEARALMPKATVISVIENKQRQGQIEQRFASVFKKISGAAQAGKREITISQPTCATHDDGSLFAAEMAIMGYEVHYWTEDDITYATLIW